MNFFQKKLTALTLAAAMFSASSTLAPRRAEASLGGLVISAGSGGAGSIIFFLGAAGAGAGAVELFKKGWNASGGKSFTSYLLAAAAALGAILLLDGDEARSSELQSISASDAARLDLTSSEWQSYEAELALVNALREEAIARTDGDLKDFEAKTALDIEIVARTLRSHWQSLSEGVLSVETQSVIQKMGRAAIAQ